MKKFLFVLLIFLAKSQDNQEDGFVYECDKFTCCGYEDVNADIKANDCINNKKFDNPREKYCCYVELSYGSFCDAINQAVYDDMDNYRSTLGAQFETSGVTIKCNSNYLIISMLSLTLLLLLL